MRTLGIGIVVDRHRHFLDVRLDLFVRDYFVEIVVVSGLLFVAFGTGLHLCPFHLAGNTRHAALGVRLLFFIRIRELRVQRHAAVVLVAAQDLLVLELFGAERLFFLLL